jgi:hypothetical protein
MILKLGRAIDGNSVSANPHRSARIAGGGLRNPLDTNSKR